MMHYICVMQWIFFNMQGYLMHQCLVSWHHQCISSSAGGCITKSWSDASYWLDAPDQLSTALVRVRNISAANAIHHLQFILGAAFNNVQLGLVWTCLCTPYVILTPNIYRTIMLETRCCPYITCYCYFISGSALHQEKSMVDGQWS